MKDKHAWTELGFFSHQTKFNAALLGQIFEKSYDEFIILNYDKVMIINLRSQLFITLETTIDLAKRKYKHKWRIC